MLTKSHQGRAERVKPTAAFTRRGPRFHDFQRPVACRKPKRRTPNPPPYCCGAPPPPTTFATNARNPVSFQCCFLRRTPPCPCDCCPICHCCPALRSVSPSIHNDSSVMDLLENLVGPGSGFSSPLAVILCGAGLVLGTCVFPVFWMRGARSRGPDCRPDEPLQGGQCFYDILLQIP